MNEDTTSTEATGVTATARTTACYGEAAMRHYRDGKLLVDNRRFPNADQLFGFAAECAIKSALMELRQCIQDGELRKEYHEHIDSLWKRASLQSLQKRYPKLTTLLRRTSPFNRWSTDLRYAADDAVGELDATSHRDTTKRVLGSVGLLGNRRGA